MFYLLLYRELSATSKAQDIEHEQFWKQVPDYIRARLCLFNTPVVENLCPASPEGNFPEKLSERFFDVFCGKLRKTAISPTGPT